MLRKLLVLAALLFTNSVFAQSVQQSGTVTNKHVPYWVTSGVIGDGGSATDSPITSLGVTNNGGAGFCVSSDRQSAAGRNQLCFGASTAAPATISLQNYGTAAVQNLQFVINGTPVTIPTGGGTFIFGNAPFGVTHVPCFSSIAGVVQDCGLSLNGGVISAGAWQATPVDIPFGGTNATTTAGARTNLGLGTMATQNGTSVAILGGLVTGLSTPTSPSDAATKAYVDATASGLTILAPSRLASAAVLPNSPTYANGASGVGATLTAGSNTTLTVDGTSTALNDVILVKNQAAPAQNGIYTQTQVGTGSVPWILTRATYFDTAAKMKVGSYTFVTSGSVNANTSYTLQSTVVTVGTDALNFVQFSSGSSGTVTSVATGAGLTGGPISTSGTVAIDYTATNTWTGPNTWSNTANFNSTLFANSNSYFGHGNPWVDVKSGANGCAAAVGNGVANDTVAIQCQINFMNSTFGGGVVNVGPGQYLVSGGGLLIKGGVRLVGASIAATTIEVATDSTAITIDPATCASSQGMGFSNMFVTGFNNSGATQPAVNIGLNCKAIIRDSYIWLGSFAVVNHGVDFLIENTFMCGFTGAVQSSGAGWYMRDKLDSCGLSTAVTAFTQVAPNAGLTPAENHFVDGDFSGYTNSVSISDAGTDVSITVFSGGVFSGPINITSAKVTIFTGAEFGSTTLNANSGFINIVGSYAFTPLTVSGASPRGCAGNAQITC